MATTPTRMTMPAWLRALVGMLAVGLGVVALQTTASVADPLLDGAIGEAVYDAVLLGSAVLCLARAALHRAERPVWAVMGAGLVLYGCGNVYWSFAFAGDPSPPFPSVADAFWLLFYPAAYVAVVTLVRRRLPHLNARLWLDGLIALLVACPLSAAVVVDAVQATTGGELAAVVTNLADPIGDMVLIGLVLGAMAVGRGRLDRTWVCFAVGILLFAAADSVYVYRVAEGTYVEGFLLDLLWPAATLVIGIAGWQPAARTRRPEAMPGVVVPVTSALIALGVLVYDHFGRVSDLALLLMGAAMLAVVWRFVLTHHQSRANLASSRKQAITDALTGLGNRFALRRDIELLPGPDEEDAEPHVLILFDLDGFKNYNDAYGHPAGDPLLTRLGARLAAALGERGTAYWMGGDEFCVLAPCPPDVGPEALIARTRAALTEQGEGFAIGASCGHALLPGDGADAAEALRAADRRLYAEKSSARISARVQSAGVLRRALVGLHAAPHADRRANRPGRAGARRRRPADPLEPRAVGRRRLPRRARRRRHPAGVPDRLQLRRVLGHDHRSALPAGHGRGRRPRRAAPGGGHAVLPPRGRVVPGRARGLGGAPGRRVARSRRLRTSRAASAARARPARR